MDILAVFTNGKAYLWYHPESDCYYIDNEDQTDGLAHQIARVEKVGKVMRVHFPELYDAHKERDVAFLTSLAEQFGLSYEQFQSSNWDNEGKTDMSDIDTDVAPPVATAKRGRKPGSTAKPSQGSALLAALDFISVVKSEINDNSAYARLSQNMAVAYNGVISAGHPIAEELQLHPHIEKLRAALNKCGKTLTITETTTGQMSVAGDRLRAVVPCLLDALPFIGPDEPAYTGDFTALKEALRVSASLASENADKIALASVLLDPNTATGTNGFAMLQYWHGVTAIPPGTVISKDFANSIATAKGNITGIGATWDEARGFAVSITFWFEGGAWLKSQCYEDRWPNIDTILNAANAPTDVPPLMFEALAAVEPFTDEQHSVYFVDGAIQTVAGSVENTGATYTVPNLPAGKIFNGKLVKQVSQYVKTIDLTSHPDRAFFFGGVPNHPIRGVLMGISGSK